MDNRRNWYLIHCKPRQEKIAYQHLQHQGYESYLPMLQVRKRCGTSFNLVSEPMFARYLFVRLHSELDNWSPIRSTRGVQTLVRFGYRPAKLPDAVIDLIKQQQADGEKNETVQPKFSPGQKVIVANGAFAGYEAIFQESSGSRRADIMLQMAGRYNRLRVDIESLDEAV